MERKKQLEWLIAWQKRIAIGANHKDCTPSQQKALHIAISKAGVKKERHYAILSAIAGRPVLSTKMLDRGEASTILEIFLKEKGGNVIKWIDEIAPADPLEASNLFMTEYQKCAWMNRK